MDIGGQFRNGRRLHAFIDGPREDRLQSVGFVCALKGGLIAPKAAVERLSELPHLLPDREIAYAHLPERIVE